MVLEIKIKAYPRKDRGGWIIYLPKSLVEDSGFPLKSKRSITAKIEGKKVVIKQI